MPHTLTHTLQHRHTSVYPATNTHLNACTFFLTHTHTHIHTPHAQSQYTRNTSSQHKYRKYMQCLHTNTQATATISMQMLITTPTHHTHQCSRASVQLLSSLPSSPWNSFTPRFLSSFHPHHGLLSLFSHGSPHTDPYPIIPTPV